MGDHERDVGVIDNEDENRSDHESVDAKSVSSVVVQDDIPSLLAMEERYILTLDLDDKE
jgi:hypothetical protein